MNKQLIFLLLTTVFMCLYGEKVSAHDIEVANADGVTIYYKWTNNKKELSVSYKGSSYDSYSFEYSGNVVIPETVDYNGSTYKVTSIGMDAFCDCIELTSVIIPDGVTYIGISAFRGCSSLLSVNIPCSVTTIYTMAFQGCSKLNTITIPNSVTEISRNAFENCRSLTSMTIPNGLTSITIPSSMTTIGSYAFAGCTSLASVHISDLAAWCDINFKDNPLQYAQHLYLDEEEIKDLVIPNGVTSIRSRAFIGFSGLNSVTIPNSVTSIGYSAFSYCSSLTSVEIPNSVTSIGERAFSGSGLTSVEVPSSVKIIGSSAFDECASLVSVIIHNGVTSIDESVFHSCSSLTSVTIPNSVISIGYSAFGGCSSLATVEIPSSVTSIGDAAFQGCSSLISITIPNSVTTIGILAFSSCSSLTSIVIPSSVISIGDAAFQGCSSLISITIPNSVTTIGNFTFRDCSSLTSLTIPNSVTSIGDNVFDGCCALISLIIPNSVTSMGKWYFGGFEQLTHVSLPNCITTVPDGAFDRCSALTSIDIPNSVTNIGFRSFYGCNTLITLTIPNNVTSIGDQAFAGCISLQQINALPTTPPLIYDKTFSNYSVPLNVPSGCVEVYKNADYWNNFTNISDGTKTYKLTYIIDGEEFKTIEVLYGSEITPEPNPIKEGYTFSGWSEIPETMPDHDVTVTGSFTINKYKLTYFVDGEEYKTYDVEYNSTITAETAPTKEGYTFSGWSEIPETMPANDVTITGTFTINKYKLIYMVDGVEYKSFDIEYNSAITPEADPTKDGYKFSGWNEIPETMPAHDVTITGSFERVYSGGDVANLIDLLLFGNVDDEDIALYDMNGDGELNIGDLILIMRAAQNNSRNRSAANRAAENQTIEFAADIVTMKPGETSALNISLSSSISGIYGIQFEVNLPEGFSLEKGSNDKIYEMSANQVDDITCNDRDLGNGTYRFFIYSSTLQELKGGSLMSLNLKADADKAFGNYAVTISNVALSDYDGHVTKEDGMSVGVKVTNSFTLLYQVDGEDYKSYEFEYGESITPEAEPTKEGYTFSGWSNIPETMPAEDVIVTGTFTVKQYILTYVVDGEVYKEYSYDYGSAITPEAEPTKEGYTFSGWSEIPETMPAKEVYVVGTFTINKYKITYVIDGEVYLTKEVEYGSWITPPNPDDHEGYDFAWEDYPDTMPAHDITINGAYTATGIEAILSSEPDVKIYTVSGKPLNKVQKGVNILRYKDGRTRKIVVK